MWKDAYLESRVLNASPIELVQMLYDHAIDSVREARRALAAGNIAARAAAISKAIGAVSELDAALDHSVDGTISRNLAGLYRYFRQRLTEANIRQQDSPLAEVELLLTELGSAWKASAKPPQEFMNPMVWNEPELASSHTWSA